MNQACWISSTDGRYWLDVRVGGLDCRLMVDTGIIDPLGRVGIEIDPSLYDAVKQAGQLSHITHRPRRDANGGIVRAEIGSARAQLLDPSSRMPIGPAMSVFVMRNAPRVPSRIGVEFFHRLSGCRVVWDLDARDWCVEYP